MDTENDLNNQRLENDLALAEMRSDLLRLGEEEMPMKRESIKTSRQVECEEDEGDKVVVEQLDDYNLLL